MQPLAYLPFGMGCECGRALIVTPEQRGQPTVCPKCGKHFGPFGAAPALEQLPAPDVSLTAMIRFADAFNPTPYFRRKWGDDFPAMLHSSWTRCVDAFKKGAAPPCPPEELLMCLAHDVVLGPHLGVPESDKLAFLHWLIGGIRHSLTSLV